MTILNGFDHNVVVVGYNSTNIIYMNPYTGVLENGTSNSFNTDTSTHGYAIPVAGIYNR
jgi:hypothetical protein